MLQQANFQRFVFIIYLPAFPSGITFFSPLYLFNVFEPPVRPYRQQQKQLYLLKISMPALSLCAR